MVALSTSDCLIAAQLRHFYIPYTRGGMSPAVWVCAVFLFVFNFALVVYLPFFRMIMAVASATVNDDIRIWKPA